MKPETRYAKSGDVHIAYQVTGDGPADLVLVPGFVSHLDADWDNPVRARLLRRVASFCRLIRFDKRGTGLSDRTRIPTLEQRMDDVRAVMDAVGSEKATLFGISDGGPMSILFAATYPERTVGLALFGSYARRVRAPDHPHGMTPEAWSAFVERLEREWGGPVAIEIFSPGSAADAVRRVLFADYFRQAASPGAAVEIMRMNGDIDVRAVLPAVRVPTLVLHRRDDRLVEVAQGRYLAAHVAGARFCELPGDDHTWSTPEGGERIVDELEEFVTGTRHAVEADRVLATVLFADIVGSTERAAAIGDREWRDLLEAHRAMVRRRLVEFRGREVDTAGDGFLASFDGPGRAVRCAVSLVEDARRLALDLRVGLHTGECELTEDKLAGLTLHIGARVAAQARPGEVLVSRTVRDLVSGSGLRFEDRGTSVLKGVPGDWPLFAVAG
jgi:class 3 adenylate cyclase